MSVLSGRARRAPRWDLLVGAVAILVVLGTAATVPAQAGLVLAGLAVGAAVALLALTNPLLALILVVLASFLRTAQKSIISTEALTPMFLLMLVALALALRRRAVEMPRLGAVEWLMTAYLAANLLSALLPHADDAIDPLLGGTAAVYRWIFFGAVLPFVVFVVAKGLLTDERSVRWVLWTTVGMTAYSAWVSILPFYGPSSLVWPRFIVDDPAWTGRAVGVFDQPVVNGLLLVIGFTVCLFLATRPGTDRRVRWGLYAVAAAAAYSVYLTHTRSALLSLVVALGLGAVLARGWRRPFVTSLVLGVVGVAANASEFFSTDRTEVGIASSSEIYDRLNIIATSFKAIGEHPFLGIGIGRFRAYNTHEHVAWSQEINWVRGYGLISHENELGIAAEIGVPGALLWIAVVLGVLWLLWRAMRELPADEFLGAPLALLGMIAMVIMVANGLTVDLRILDFALLLPFLYAGMVIGQLERHRARRRPVPPGRPGGGLPGGLSMAEQVDFDDAHRPAAPEPAADGGGHPARLAVPAGPASGSRR